MSVLFEAKMGHPWMTLLSRLPPPNVSLTPETHCVVVDNVDSGKSTTLGVLTRGSYSNIDYIHQFTLIAWWWKGKSPCWFISTQAWAGNRFWDALGVGWSMTSDFHLMVGITSRSFQSKFDECRSWTMRVVSFEAHTTCSGTERDGSGE